MATQDEKIAEEIREERRRKEIKKLEPKPINETPVKMAKYAWVFGTVVLDIMTAYYIWHATTLFYGIVWILVGAGGLVWSENQRERIGNNTKQKDIGQLGVWVSAGAVFVAALIMGVVYLMGTISSDWVVAGAEIVSVCMFAYHLVQAYRYHIYDDAYIAANEDALDEADSVREVRAIYRAARKVEAKRGVHNERDEMHKKYGPAFDAAYGKDIETPELKRVQPAEPQKQNYPTQPPKQNQ